MEPVFNDIKVGDQVINLVKPAITKTQLIRYAGATGDFNPLHFDDEVGRAAGFEGVVAHGMLIMGIACQGVTNWVSKRSLRKIKVRFKGVTSPGAILNVKAEVAHKRIENEKGIVACTLEVTDQKQDVKLSGTFEAELPL